MDNNAAYIDELLFAWEEVHKRGHLTLWILLALKDGPKHMNEIKEFIAHTTNGTLSVDDKSIYRALRRYYDTELVDFTAAPGKGPDLKVYSLAPIGAQVLQRFVERNITLFLQPRIKRLIERSST
jgi:DNA-binding PadR family transcriptional regulator